MDREQIKQDILNKFKNNILLELPTGMGKSRIALDILFSLSDIKNILIVVPRLVLIDNWKGEFVKWGYSYKNVTFVTYVSFSKLYKNWDIVIYDECHHLTDRCIEAISHNQAKYNILLSATVNRKIKEKLYWTFKPLDIHKIRIKEAIKEEILPDPTVYLIPLELDNSTSNFEIVKNSKCKQEVHISYKERWKYKDCKNMKVIIHCTQKEYYDDISSLIQWYKNKSSIQLYKRLFLQKSGERLKWLSAQKTQKVKEILLHFSKERTLTFCSNIKQTEELGRYSINSKNDKSDEILEKFNKGQINHITACEMLNEGINLVNCKVGIYAALNSSDRLILQKTGRLLRHKQPIIVIPYYKSTRDEEIVKVMCTNYNSELIKTINL